MAAPTSSTDKQVVTTGRVTCDGNGADPSLGHPRIWLSFGEGEREIVCPYCSRSFVLAEGASAGHGH
jgi:uncharacterized Zn-finger protein